MLDGGPARTQRPINDNLAKQQPEPIHRQDPPSREMARGNDKDPSEPISTKKRSSVLIRWAIVAVVVALVAGAGWFVWANPSKQDLGINSDKYQAVFLVGGQLYFGKLEVLGGDYLRLSDVFYVQPSDSNTEEVEEEDDVSNAKDTASNNLRLVKLGSEVHGPEDEMIINRDQVLFIENLKSDSKVVQLITDHKLGNR